MDKTQPREGDPTPIPRAIPNIYKYTHIIIGSDNAMAGSIASILTDGYKSPDKNRNDLLVVAGGKYKHREITFSKSSEVSFVEGTIILNVEETWYCGKVSGYILSILEPLILKD